jgi:colanic acid biosynthesis glycosyl transferase WcaI
LRRPRILVLTQHYQPEPNFITTEVSEALARRADVTVVTSHPNYPRGRFYEGARYLRIERSTINGVVVWRVPFFPDHSLSLTRRALSYLSFALMATIVAPFVGGRPDSVWVYHGPFTTGIAALFFKLTYRSRVVFTCADLWPESFVATGVVKSNLILSLASAYNRAINRAADFIVCSTQGTVRRLKEYGISADRLTFIPVWIPSTSELTSGVADIVDSEATIVYAGNVGPAQSLDIVVLGAARLAAAGEHIHFDIYGSGAAESVLRELAERAGAVNVTFHGLVPFEQAFKACAHAMAQVVCLQSSPYFSMTIPSKLFAAFGAGSPILAGLQGEAASLAEASGGSIAFDASDVDSFVAAVRQIVKMTPRERQSMRSSLQRYFSENFDPKVLIEEYVDILTSHEEKTLGPTRTAAKR